MSFHFLGPDPVERQVVDVLQRIAAGEAPKHIETANVDVKEEPGRRAPDGGILPGMVESEEAARYLAEEMAWLANTPGGGAIVLGVADDGARIGTEQDVDWLRHRIYELTGRKLTVDIKAVDLEGTRLLALVTHQAVEPVRVGGKLKWRVGAHAVEVDPATVFGGKFGSTGIDWSAQPSGHTLGDVRPFAAEVARRYLNAAGDPDASDLASATDEDLLRRLNLVGGDGRLTHAGSLLFVATPTTGIDYIRRDVPGGDSTTRVQTVGSLLEQVWEVDRASQVSNRVVHAAKGLAHGQLRAIPERAVREAIVNGVVHRDWRSSLPTTVEHVGDVLTVTSPGGFTGGVDAANIITHPPAPRCRSLAEAVAKLRLAEREGIGVDRMVRDMLAMGRPEPEITEVSGPFVRVGLLGGPPDQRVVELLTRIMPDTVAKDVDALLLIQHLNSHAWVDAPTAAPVLQRPPREASASIERLAAARIDGGPVIVAVDGLPAGDPPAYRLDDIAARVLGTRVTYLNAPSARTQQILEWAHARGRVSTTEVADMMRVSIPYAGTLLTRLEQAGHLDPGRQVKRGRGFYYVPVE